MKNEWFKILLLGVACICSFGLLGCHGTTKISSKDEAGQVIQKKLEKKYDRQFQILEVETVSVSSGVPLGKGTTYFADVYCEDDAETFSAEIKKDGSEFKDNYYQYLFEKELEENVYEWVEQIEGTQISEYKAEFMDDEGDWTGGKSLDDMLTGTETYICMTVDVEAETLDQAAETCYEVYRELEEHHAEPDIRFCYRGASVNVASPYKNNDKDKIIEGIRNRFQAELE